MKKHPAQLWDKKENKKVQCNLCQHRCVIAEDKKGLCGVRQNQDGELVTLNYAKAIAKNIDPIEKKPLYHFLPGTDIFSIASAGCNFRCSFCQNWQISQITKGKTGQIIGEELEPGEVVNQALTYDCRSIAYTYTEPTIFFEYAYDTAKLAQKAGLKNVFVTNGYQTQETIELMVGLIDAVNIDLKSFNKAFYKKICGADLSKVLSSIKLMHEKGIWIELTTLIVPGQNDSDSELKQIAEFIASLSKNIPWHISRFFPTYKMSETQTTPISTIKKAFNIGKKAGLNFIYAGNIDSNKMSFTQCANCSKTLIKRDVYFVESNLQDDGHCPYCGTELPGIFS
jgi:pyruvate formate lyase activating enzyme